jgi:hypothetical protein
LKDEKELTGITKIMQQHHKHPEVNCDFRPKLDFIFHQLIRYNERLQIVVVTVRAHEGNHSSTQLLLSLANLRYIPIKISTPVPSLGRAGSKCWLGKCPIVRGVVMKPGGPSSLEW